MTRVCRTAIAAIFAGLVLSGVDRAWAAPAPDADASAASSENQPILRDSSADSAAQPAKTGVTAAPAGGFDSVRVVLALGGVVGLILLLRVGLRQIFPGVIPQRSTRAMQLLCRFPIAPRQHLLLVQVGKRLIVVGDGGAQLNPLCEITAPEEVEAIVTQVREESASSLRRFELFFGKARKGYTEEPAGEETDKVADEPEPAPAAPASEAPFDASHELNEPALSQTRDELSGLAQKVRALANQLGRQ